MKKLIATLFFVALPFVFWWLSEQLGYEEISTPIPSASVVHVPGFEEFGKEAQSVLQNAREEIGLPSMSAALAHNGRLIWTGVVGWQDLGSNTPATAATRYRIGSTSKSVTATLAARLVDQSILELDKPIETWFEHPPNAAWKLITPRQLMSHTAGFPGYQENRDYLGVWRTLMLQKEFTDVENALQVFDEAPLLSLPGTSFHYSSFDVNLMSVVMQYAGERPFLELIDATVLQPLGLQDTFADRTTGSTTNLATFYERRDKAVKPWRDVNLSVKWARGGFLSTPTDLVHLGGAWLDPQFISNVTRTMFWTPQLLANGDINPQRYGLGWRSDSTEIEGVAYQRRHHGGVSKGSMNWFVVYPDERIVVDIAINARADNFSEFARQEKRITALFLKAIAPSPILNSTLHDQESSLGVDQD